MNWYDVIKKIYDTFNPVIFYYCLDSENNIVYHVAEVHNTFGEGHLYILNGGRKSKVRHVGDLGACVCAIDEATAIDAMNAISVEYNVLPSIHDMEDGLKDSEHPIHDRGKYHIGESNVQKRVFQQFGDLD